MRGQEVAKEEVPRMSDRSEQAREDALTLYMFSKTLTRFAQAMSRGDSGEALALHSELVLHDKATAARIAELEAALEPFAALGALMEDKSSDDALVYGISGSDYEARVVQGDFRRAAALRASGEAPPEGGKSCTSG